MGMHHSCSGKHGYDLHYQKAVYQMDKEQLTVALVEEDRLRLSATWQEQFALFDTNHWRQQVCHLLQKEALRVAGVHEKDLNAALVALRSARAKFRHDPTFYKPIYVRFDRAVGCATPLHEPIEIGGPLDVPLLDPSTSAPTTLVEALESRSLEESGSFNGPVVVLAGSIT